MGEITDALRRAWRRSRDEAGGSHETGPTERREETLESSSLSLWDDLPAAPDPASSRPRHNAVEAEPRRWGGDPPRAIPRAKSSGWEARTVWTDPSGPMAQRFRHFALQVRRHLDERASHSLLVTSALDGEGKTVIACNLALALASMAGGDRIALVDLDLRKPGVAQAMGVEAAVGLERVLAGEAPLDSACVSTDVPALDLFVLDRPLPHAHEVLARSALPDLLEELDGRYGIVVCDMPPVLLVPDVELVAAHAGGCVVVARAGHTRHSAFREMLGLLPTDKVVGGFLNQARVPMRAYHYLQYDADEELGGPG